MAGTVSGPFRMGVNVVSRVMRRRRHSAARCDPVRRPRTAARIAASTKICCVLVTHPRPTGHFDGFPGSDVPQKRPEVPRCALPGVRQLLRATGRAVGEFGEGTHVSYLLRVRLPDRPGSLGALAVALGSVGADILSLDVVERGAGHAIDDLVVDVEPGKLPDTLLTAAESLPGVTVDSIRPYAGILDTHRELELIDQVAAAPRDRLQVLVDGAPRVLRVGWATVLGVGPNGIFRIAGSPGSP